MCRSAVIFNSKLDYSHVCEKRCKLGLIVMSSNLEQEKDRKRESRRQASEAQREEGRKRSRARDEKKKNKTKQRRHFFVGRTTLKFCIGSEKMKNASGHQCKVKMSGSEKR